MTSGKRWGIVKQKRLLLLGNTRGLRLSSTQWNQPRLIEIYLPFTLKKSFCTLYHELCQLWPWGQSTHIFKENTVCKRDFKMEGWYESAWSLSKYGFFPAMQVWGKESSMCAPVIGCGRVGDWADGQRLYQAGWWRPDEACPQSSTKMGEGNMRMSVGKLYSAPCSQRGALPLLMEKPWLQLILNDCCACTCLFSWNLMFLLSYSVMMMKV